MADIREKILRYYRGTEGADIAAKLVDTASQAAKSHGYRITGFLDPYGLGIAETIAANQSALQVEFFGGYAGAERQRAAFVNDDFMGNVHPDIAVVKVSWNNQYYHLSHRDLLGALMGIGLERSAFGDILPAGDMARILVDEKIVDFLCSNLLKAGSAVVTCERDALENIVPRAERCKEIKAIVASLRVDSVASAGFGLSRSRAAADIAADKMKLNWQKVGNVSKQLKTGDIISMRGRGRLEVIDIGGVTKKGRICIFLKRYL